MKVSHPLREDVSWNITFAILLTDSFVILFVRMWVEIPFPRPSLMKNFVILFVRMWVEMWETQKERQWELVILFVRMWVEIVSNMKLSILPYRHPLREDVSWNVPALNVIVGFVVILFVRMWVEIPLRQPNQLLQSRHPLREDVSWNDAENAKGGESISHPLREDVSWNINRWGGERMYDSHPLREDVSWNLEEYGVNHRCSNMVLLVGRWIEISLIVFLSFARRSHYYTSFNLNIKLNYRNLRGNFYMCS